MFPQQRKNATQAELDASRLPGANADPEDVEYRDGAVDVDALESNTLTPTAADTDMPLVLRDPEIRREGEAPESSDKVALFKGEAIAEKDAPIGEVLRRRHGILMASLEEEGERQAEERQQAQIDDDYYHHMQWRPEEARVLMSRGQAPLVFNEARGSIDWLAGTERKLRKDYKIRPRSKEDEAMAECKTKVFKYTEDVNMAPWHRSRAFKQMVTSGLGWLEEGINTDPERELIYSGSEDWRRIFRDSRGREFDCEDWRYIHRRKILDLDYACALLPRAANHLIAAAGRWSQEDEEQDDVWYLGVKLTAAHVAGAGIFAGDGLFSDEYSIRRAGSALWDHGRRQSIEILETWYRVPERVHVFNSGPLYRKIVNKADPAHQQLLNDRHATYEAVKMRMRCMVGTKFQPCWDGPSPFRHGRFPLIPIWGYVRGRDGVAYGAMRGMRDPQDDLNKRRSKALYALSARRTIYKEGTLEDPETTREEMARVDAMIAVKGDINTSIKSDDAFNQAQVQGNLEMAQMDAEHIRNAGGVTGENLGHDTRASSGKAIIAKQEQGSMVTYELFDNLFLAFKLAGQQRLSNIEQFCNQEWTFRLDPVGRKPPEWVTVNKVDPRTGQVLDDITASQADFVVDQQDYRAVLSQAAMDSMFELLTQMANFAPNVVLNLLDLVVDSSDVPGKDEWVSRIRSMTGMRDPSKPPTPEEEQADAEKAAKAQRVEEANIQMVEAKVAELRAKVTGANATQVLTNLQALLAAVEAAGTIVTIPGAAPAADSLAKSAGYIDQTPQDAIVVEPTVQPALPAPDGALQPELGSGSLPPPEAAPQPPMA